MAKLQEIKKATAEFFEMHWDKSSKHPTPEWSNEWGWHGPVPYHDMAGVYALLAEHGEVVYIGLGASRGVGRYEEHGISRRLIGHVIETDQTRGRGFYRVKPKWSKVIDIGAVGFPREFSYLALALEDYLIGHFNPPRNSAKKTRS